MSQPGASIRLLTRCQLSVLGIPQALCYFPIYPPCSLAHSAGITAVSSQQEGAVVTVRWVYLRSHCRDHCSLLAAEGSCSNSSEGLPSPEVMPKTKDIGVGHHTSRQLPWILRALLGNTDHRLGQAIPSTLQDTVLQAVTLRPPLASRRT